MATRSNMRILCGVTKGRTLHWFFILYSADTVRDDRKGSWSWSHHTGRPDIKTETSARGPPSLYVWQRDGVTGRAEKNGGAEVTSPPSAVKSGCRLFVGGEKPFIGASPDRLVSCCCGEGIQKSRHHWNVLALLLPQSHTWRNTIGCYSWRRCIHTITRCMDRWLWRGANGHTIFSSATRDMFWEESFFFLTQICGSHLDLL